MSTRGWIAEANRAPLGKVLADLGLNPDHRDHNSRPGRRHACPACEVGGLAELPDRDGEGEGWYCWHCRAAGDVVAAVVWREHGRAKVSGAAWAPVRDWFAARRWCDPDPRRNAPRLAPARPLAPFAEKPQRKVAGATVAAALRELESDRNVARLVAWWCARGFSVADAERLARVGDVHALPDAVGRAVQAVLTRAELDATPTGRRSIWITRRDPSGAPCSVERRWAPGVTPPPGEDGKAKGLGGAPAGVFGCELRAAQALADGCMVVVVEGGPDWACAVAAAPAGAEVVGTPGKDLIPAMVARILDRARLAANGARLGRLVVVPHADDGWKRDATPNNGACAERMAQAVALAQGAGVACAWVRVPFGPKPGAGRSGVGDLAELRDLAAIAQALAEPEDLPELDPATDADAERVESLALDAPDALREWVRGLVAVADSGRLVVGAAAPGMGKSYAAAHVAAEVAASGRWVLYVAHSHDLAGGVGSAPEVADDAAAERIRRAAAAAGLTVPIHTPAGLTRRGVDGRPLCKALDDTEGTTDHRHLGDALAAVGRAVCGVPGKPGACPHAANCPVRPLLPADLTRPGVIACVAAQAPSIWAALPDSIRRTALLILDDVSAAPTVAEVSRAALEGAGRALGTDPAVVAFVAALDSLARSLPMPAAARHAEHILGLDLAAVLAAVPSLAELRAEWPRGSSVEVERSRTERGRLALRPMAGREMVTADARAAVEAAAAVAGGRPCADAKDRPLALALRVERAAGVDARVIWTLELRRAPWVPAGAAVVALDGTAHVTPLDWTHAAQGRALDVRRLTVRKVAPPTAAWVRLGALDSGAMFERAPDGLIGITATGAAAFAARLADMAGRCQIEGARSVGIITHKAAADALRLGLGLDAKDPKIDPSNAGVVRLGEAARTLRDLLKPGELLIGHFGADGVGSNRFKDCAALAILGTPRPPEGPMRADCAAMGLDPESHWSELRAERVERELRQAIARARHVRNPGRLLYVTASTPPVEGHDLPGVAWAAESPNAGAASGDWRRVVRLAVLAALAADRGALVVAGAAGPLGDARTWATDAQTIAARRGWVETRARAAGRGHPPSAWAPAGMAVDATAERAALAAAVEAKTVEIQSVGILARFAELATAPVEPPCSLRQVCKYSPPPDLAVAEAPVLTPARPAPPGVDRVVDEALGRLMARRGRGAPTAAELAGLAGCPLPRAAAALAAGMELAEALAEAKGADWPPPAWAELPPVVPSTPPANEDAPDPAPEVGPVEAARHPPKAPAWSARYAALYAEPKPAAPPVTSSWPGLPCPPAPRPMPSLVLEWCAEALLMAGTAPNDEMVAEVAFQAGCNSTAAAAATAAVAAFYSAGLPWPPSPRPMPPRRAAPWPRPEPAQWPTG